MMTRKLREALFCGLKRGLKYLARGYARLHHSESSLHSFTDTGILTLNFRVTLTYCNSPRKVRAIKVVHRSIIKPDDRPVPDLLCSGALCIGIRRTPVNCTGTEQRLPMPLCNLLTVSKINVIFRVTNPGLFQGR